MNVVDNVGGTTGGWAERVAGGGVEDSVEEVFVAIAVA